MADERDESDGGGKIVVKQALREDRPLQNA